MRAASLLACLALPTPCQGPETGGGPEPECLVPVLRNGSFDEALTAGIAGLPWWDLRISPGGRMRVEEVDGRNALRIAGDVLVRQYLPAYAPWVDRVVLRGSVRGSGGLTLGGGPHVTHDFVSAGWRDFEVDVATAELAAGSEFLPRLTLVLHGVEERGVPVWSSWTGIEVLAPLPCPAEADLRAELLGHLDAFFSRVLAVALDGEGEPTPFLALDFDARTGEALGPMRRVAGEVTFHELLFEAWRAEPREAWRAALVEFARAYMERCLHPNTGLPCRWDPVADVRLGDEPVEIHRGLGFLVDLATHGPAELRAPALAAAERAARTILARGVQPDGEIAAKYRPRDAQPRFDVPHLRRLDVPAQLARLAALSADEELAAALLRAAEEACLTLQYDHYWPGTWDAIDPGFDDNFGHYGARATWMWTAHPENPVFRALAMSGYGRYAPLWRDAVRYGGNVASDQVRCWRIARDLARLEPSIAPEVEELLDRAAHGHFQGEQLANGVWTDLTVQGFRPSELPVGDLGGVPVNLLEGLGIAYDGSPEARARFTAVLRTTVERMGAAHGFPTDRRADVDATQPVRGLVGSLRFATGLVPMLEALTP